MEDFVITTASNEERTWAAQTMANSQPWKKLGVTFGQCLKTCNDPEYLIFIAHSNNLPCGAIVMQQRGVAGSPYVKSIVVPENFKEKGIGTALMRFVEEYFRAISKHMFLCVSSFNKAAQVFYKRLGYEPVGEFKDYIIEGESEILMHNKLK
jgi:ribosomal protein S18 acetylase RimI-like enzyme